MGWLHKAFYFTLSQEEKFFQLTHSLCDEASEYAFSYLPNDALQSFDVLVAALEA